jgi:lactate dehydrogenase-like 2-hydroxyacid dehydrogenase
LKPLNITSPDHQRGRVVRLHWVIKGGWNIADCVARSYNLEAMNVGTVAAGRIGLRVLRLLKPFDVKLHYLDRHRYSNSLPANLSFASPKVSSQRKSWLIHNGWY